MAASSLVFEMEETVDGRADEQRRRREDPRGGRRTTRTSDSSSSSPKRLRLCDTPPSPRTVKVKVRRRRGAHDPDDQGVPPIPSPPAVGTSPPRGSPRRIFDVREAHTPESKVFELEEVDQTASKSDHVHVEAVCTPVPRREIYYVEETAWRLHRRHRRRRRVSAGASFEEERGEDDTGASHPTDDDGGDAVEDGDGDGDGLDVSDDAEDQDEGEDEGEGGEEDDDEDDNSASSSSSSSSEEPWADLKPLLPAPPLPPLPPNWSFDERSRVLLGDLRGSFSRGGDSRGGGRVGGRISRQDEVFMLRMMERDDVTVVTEGLVMPEELDQTLWSMDYLRDTVGGEVYHRFRVFERVWELEDEGDANEDGDGPDGECDGPGSEDGGGGAGANMEYAGTSPMTAAIRSTPLTHEKLQWKGNSGTEVRKPLTFPEGSHVPSSTAPHSPDGAKKEAMSTATAAPPSFPPAHATATAAPSSLRPPPAASAFASSTVQIQTHAAASPEDGVTRGNKGDGAVTCKGGDDDDSSITTPHPNDVLIQVGGLHSSQVGNKLLNTLASKRRERYKALNPSKLRGDERKAAYAEQQVLAEEIVRVVKAQDPPGRFLKKGKVGTDGSMVYEVVGENGCIKKAKMAMGYVGKAQPPPHLNGNPCTAVKMSSTAPSGTCVPPSWRGLKEGAISTSTAAPPSFKPAPATEFVSATEPRNGHHHQRHPCPLAVSHSEAKTMKEPPAAATSRPPLPPPPAKSAPKPANGDHPAHSHSHHDLSEDAAKSAPAPVPSPSRSTRRAAAAAASKRPMNGYHQLHAHQPVAVSSSSLSHGQQRSTLPSPLTSPPPPTIDAVPQVGAAATPTNGDGDGEDGRHRQHYPVLGPGHKRYHVTHRETGSCRALRVRDFVRYLEERERQLSAIAERAERRRRMRTSGRGCCDAASSSSQWQPDSPEEEAQCRQNGRGEEMFRYEDEDGIERIFNCVDTVLYMIDYDMVKLLPALHRDFVGRFRFPEILPGEAHCLMNKINPGGRPFMGPNLYVTPPSAFTHFHQDGHGTVDSGHQCLSGYNEVIMLRRMTEEHKKHALFLLNGEDPIMYDALYGLPHADGKREMPQWPSSDDIQRCRDMNYYPSVFVLKPGQFVHINKGRLHAFRKMAPTRLPERDCHFDLRSTLLTENPDLADVERLCVSVAWDWTYKGITSDGTNRETAAVLECASLNRKNQTNSLAIPETSILYLARELSNKGREEERSEAKHMSAKNLLCSPIHPQPSSFAYQPKAIVALRGILPSLRHVVERHKAAYLLARQGMTQCNGPKVSVASRPNSWENPQLFTLDPYGNDFFCKLCHEELSNLYMHCDGCEMILNKDFNICVSCHSEGKYKVRVQMHPLNEKKHSTINHTGDFHRNRQSRCPCKNGPVCRNCSYCAGCSCKCHQHFTLQYRFMDISDEVKLLERVESAVGSRRVGYGAETEERLLASRPLPSRTTSALTCEEAACDRRGSEDLEEHQASEMVAVNGVKRKDTQLFPNGLEAARRKTEMGKVESVCHTEPRFVGRARRKCRILP